MVLHPLSFADGNTAVEAADTIFIIHRGVLARRSQILEDAISALDSTDQINGCPVLHLDENPNDLAHFLLVIYDGVSHLKHDPSDFETVSAVLRLATKYEAHKIREDVLRGMFNAWPRNLAKWEAREASAIRANGLYEPSLSYPHPILVINLAREIDAPELLPSAFYDLSRRPPSQITAGYTCQRTSVQHTLSPDDLMNVLKGKQYVSRFLSSFIVNAIEHRVAPPTCIYAAEQDPVQKRNCQAAFEAVAFEILKDVSGLISHRSSDPLFAITDAEGLLSREGKTSTATGASVKACQHCRVAFAVDADVAREELWNKLPYWFGIDIPNWSM